MVHIPLIKGLLKNVHNLRQTLLLQKNISKRMRPDDVIAPTHLAIETTNICPAKCVFCPSQFLTRPRGVMDMDLFKRIIDDAKNCSSINFITHGGLGEPLVDTLLAERVNHEKSMLGAQIQIHTNGALLSSATTQKLFDAGLDVLSISLNAFHSRTHRQVTGLDYDQVRKNTEQAFKIKEKSGVQTDIRITMVQTKNITQAEVKDFIAYWRKFTSKVAVHPQKNWGGWHKNNVTDPKFPCKWIWHMMSVNWDGSVTLCHEDYDAKHVIGNLKNSTILEIFNCQDLQEIRTLFAKGQFPSRDQCHECSRLRLDKAFWLESKIKKLPSGIISYTYRPNR
ncbi:MAG: radical SAM protein [Desulfobulbaceae bacterium]|nr:radical SAM protein [Desulfobulbaceae bacterium]